MNGCLGLFKIACSLPDKNGGVSETSSNPQVRVRRQIHLESCGRQHFVRMQCLHEEYACLVAAGIDGTIEAGNCDKGLTGSLFDIIFSSPSYFSRSTVALFTTTGMGVLVQRQLGKVRPAANEWVLLFWLRLVLR